MSKYDSALISNITISS